MADDTCRIEGCTSLREQRPGHQSRMCVTHRCQSSKRTCTFPGCDKPHNAKGYCKDHYDLWRYHGDPSIRLGRPDNGWLHPEGYRKRSRHGHPLADANGNVFEQRLVLYEKVGPGRHLCHWCGVLVDWTKTWPRDPDALVADHLDHNRVNNDPANLVPSCQLCNYKRTKKQRVKAKKRGTTAQRGYGSYHRRLRRKWQVELNRAWALGQPGLLCWRCHKPILRDQPWDLGHFDKADGHAGPEHAACNRATAKKRS